MGMRMMSRLAKARGEQSNTGAEVDTSQQRGGELVYQRQALRSTSLGRHWIDFEERTKVASGSQERRMWKYYTGSALAEKNLKETVPLCNASLLAILCLSGLPWYDLATCSIWSRNSAVWVR